MTQRTSDQARPAAPAQDAMIPAVDIFENDTGITVVADMPGVSRDRLAVRVNGEQLVIEGSVEVAVPENLELLHREVRSPFYHRSFTLSRELDPAKIDAKLKDGVLKLHIPKSEEARPRQIQVQIG